MRKRGPHAGGTLSSIVKHLAEAGERRVAARENAEVLACGGGQRVATSGEGNGGAAVDGELESSDTQPPYSFSKSFTNPGLFSVNGQVFLSEKNARFSMQEALGFP